MTRSSLIRGIALGGTLLAAISLTGTALAVTLPGHAGPTAVAAVAASGVDENADDSPGQDAHALAVSTAASSDQTGGPHDNHGGYVSCIARGGSDCTSANPTLPTHGTAPTPPTQAKNGAVPAR